MTDRLKDAQEPLNPDGMVVVGGTPWDIVKQAGKDLALMAQGRQIDTAELARVYGTFVYARDVLADAAEQMHAAVQQALPGFTLSREGSWVNGEKPQAQVIVRRASDSDDVSPNT